MSYKVVRAFMDLQDNNHIYNVGDLFPHDGSQASDERLKELSSKDNKIGEILIEKQKDDNEPVAVVQHGVATDEEIDEAIENLHRDKKENKGKKKER